MNQEEKREPRWLDLRLAQRLAGLMPASALRERDGVYAMPPWEELLLALRRWQVRQLRANFLNIASNSLGYRKKLGKDALPGLMLALEETAASASGEMEFPEEKAAFLEEATAAALRHLPFTTPEELAEAPESFLSISQGDVSGIISLPTSGTSTGQGKRVFCSEEDLQETADFFRHGMQYMVRPGRDDQVALLMSGGRPGSVGSLFLRAMRDLGVPCIVPGFVPPGKKGEDSMVRRLIDVGPTCLVGVPGQMLLLARHEQAPELARTVHSVLLSGDSVMPPTRKAIAAGLQAEVFVHYGLTETGLGGAVECREHAGCHMREADLIHEIVDEEGKPVEKGRWGEIVITTLTRKAMPLLRYRTGDEGRILPGPCGCASVLGRLQARGRMSQRLSLPDGSALRITDLDKALYALPYVQSYTPVVQGEGRDQRLKLLIRAAEGAGDAALFEAERAVGSLPGLRLCLAGETPAAADLLPVLLVLERPPSVVGKHMRDLRSTQAKQRFVRENENRG